MPDGILETIEKIELRDYIESLEVCFSADKWAVEQSSLPFFNTLEADRFFSDFGKPGRARRTGKKVSGRQNGRNYRKRIRGSSAAYA